MRQIAAKRDAAEPRLVEYLTRVGCSVTQISSGGIPDLLVGYKSLLNFLLEVKSDKGSLTEYQIKFFDTWRGQCDIIRTIKDIKEVLRRVMPVYVYQCPECGRFEIKQRYEDAPVENCPQCGADVKRIIQNAAVIYVADGFTKKTKREN